MKKSLVISIYIHPFEKYIKCGVSNIHVLVVKSVLYVSIMILGDVQDVAIHGLKAIIKDKIVDAIRKHRSYTKHPFAFACRKMKLRHHRNIDKSITKRVCAIFIKRQCFWFLAKRDARHQREFLTEITVQTITRTEWIPVCTSVMRSFCNHSSRPIDVVFEFLCLRLSDDIQAQNERDT